MDVRVRTVLVPSLLSDFSLMNGLSNWGGRDSVWWAFDMRPCLTKELKVRIVLEVSYGQLCYSGTDLVWFQNHPKSLEIQRGEESQKPNFLKENNFEAQLGGRYMVTLYVTFIR